MSASVVVWGVWGVLAIAGLAFVGIFGRDCPWMDEWGMLAVLAGDTDTADWVMSPHHEHRYPVPRLLFITLFRAAGDLRMAMVTNVILLAGTAAMLIRVARQVRRRTSLADVFFPLAFLHAGHWENVLMGYQLCFTLPTWWGAGLVCLACRQDDWSWGRIGLSIGASVLLAGCGAAGLFFSATGAIWLIVLGRALLRHGYPWRASVAGAGVAVVVTLLGLVAASYPGSPLLPTRRPVDLAWFAARVIGMSFGPSTGWLWPIETLAVVCAWLLGMVAAIKRGSLQSAGLGAVLIGTAALVVGLTWGRGWGGPEVAVARYTTLFLPGMAAAFLMAATQRGLWAQLGIPVVFAVLATVAWPFNLIEGLKPSTRISQHVDALTVDLREGFPATLIGERYDWQLFMNHPKISEDFDTATRIGFTPFRNRGRTQPICGSTVMQPTPGTLRFGLTAPPGTIAIRVRGEFVAKQTRMADYRVRWQEIGSAQWHQERFQVVKNRSASVLIHVHGAPTEIEILPNREPDEYRVISLELVTSDPPAESPTESAASH